MLFIVSPIVRVMVVAGPGVGVMGKTGVVEDKGSLAHCGVSSIQAVVFGFALVGAEG